MEIARAPTPANRVLVPLVAVLFAGACSGPQPTADEAAIDALARDTVYVDRRGHTGLVSYLHSGKAEVARIVFLHGAPGSARDWADFLVAPTDGQEYVAIDRPGFGGSRPEGAVVSFDAQAAAIAPLLASDGDVPVVVVGHSSGAALALSVAARFPERVDGVVAVSGAVDPSLAQPHWLRALADRAPLRWLLPRSVANANRELLALEAQLRALVPRLASVRQPVHIIHGARDESVPFANVAFLREHLPKAPVEVVRLENAGHYLPWRATVVVRTRINTLVAQLCGGLSQCDRTGSL